MRLSKWSDVIELLGQTNGTFQLVASTNHANPDLIRGYLLLSEAGAEFNAQGDRVMVVPIGQGRPYVPRATEVSIRRKKELQDKLAQLRGPDFDREYMSAMVKDHETDVKDFDTQSKDGNDADIKAFARKTLPTLQEHLKMAQAAAQKVGAK